MGDTFSMNPDHNNGEVMLNPWTQPQCATNAALIAAARNMLPKLIAVAKAAGAFIDAVDRSSSTLSGHPSAHALMDALIALERD